MLPYLLLIALLIAAALRNGNMVLAQLIFVGVSRQERTRPLPLLTWAGVAPKLSFFFQKRCYTCTLLFLFLQKKLNNVIDRYRLFLGLFILLCVMSVLLAFMRVCTTSVPGVPGGQKRALDSQGLELQRLGAAICVLGRERWSLAKAVAVLTTESTLQHDGYSVYLIFKITSPQRNESLHCLFYFTRFLDSKVCTYYAPTC